VQKELLLLTRQALFDAKFSFLSPVIFYFFNCKFFPP
jgi:hypothetical protein